jgi:restriction system protein
MARREQGVIEDLVEIASKFPWWVSVVLAIVTYLVLHSFASMGVAVTADAKNIGAVVSTQIFRTFAMIAQYLLPGALLVGAAASVLGRHKRNALHENVATAGVRGALEKMSWQEFEMLVGESFRRRGFSVEETGGGGADGGVDLVVSRGADRYLVQCKQWKARQVGVETVRELYGVMAARRVAGGYVVTSGVFTDEAKRFAEGREIKLIAGDQLVEMIRTTQTAVPIKDPVAAAESPSCPQCGSPMVLKTARKGANRGNSFWGCPKYPNCRGARPA